MKMPPRSIKSTLERFALPSLVSPASRSTHTPPIPTAFQLLQRMVVGHTVQPCINAACGGGIVRIDVGLSAAMRNAPPQALEVLRDGRVRVLTERGVLAV